MTDKQIQEFVKQVKVRKIRRNYWNKDWYFISNGEYDEDIFYGIDQAGNEEYCWIHEGLHKDENRNYWEFYNPFEQYLKEVLND